MKASEYIKRIQDLIEVVGDVEVVIEEEENLYETALLPDACYRKKLIRDVYVVQDDEKDKVVPVIVIHELNWFAGKEEDGSN